MTPALAISCAALPPEGVDSLTGGPAAKLTPTLDFPAELLLKAQGVRVVFLDVDGVLTDGGLYYTQDGETIKRFNTLDGHGLKLLQRVGITPVIISGRDSKALRSRLAELGLEQMHCGVDDKLAAAEQTLQTLGVTWAQAAAIGDDWPDLAVMRRCALACAPRDAHAEVRAISHHVTRAQGGAGAVRELCDLLLVANAKYAQLLKESIR